MGVNGMRGFVKLRRTLVVFAVVVLFSGVEAWPASAASQGNHNPNNYLALGDSVPFGYNPLLRTPGVNPDVFVGYPELASQRFRPRLKVSNASCPGETSTSLITGTRPDNGCQDYRQFIGQLHVAYTGSQLQYATRYVRANPRTGLVTMTVGANDVFLLIASCGGNPGSACVANGLPTVLLTLSHNLQAIYSALAAAGFHGQLVAVTYYATNYNDPVGVAGVGLLNSTLAGVTRAFGGRVADGFTAFQKAAAPFNGDSCAAGLLIHLTPTTCDIHPSPAGAALLADAVVHAS
jgi:lysophospholipase L1-like esterase